MFAFNNVAHVRVRARVCVCVCVFVTYRYTTARKQAFFVLAEMTLLCRE